MVDNKAILTRIYEKDRKAVSMLQLKEDVKYREDMLHKIIKFYIDNRKK